MRIFVNFKEARSEIRRDLGEMGIKVHTQTYQDKFIGDKPEFATMELQNYQYQVTDTKEFRQQLSELGVDQKWLDVEWSQRRAAILGEDGADVNPGEAWKFNPDLWEQFLERDGKFAYSYPERLYENGQEVLDRLKEDPSSRQLYLSVWNPMKDGYRLGKRRVPCTLGYLLQVRRGRVNLTYLQRSADFHTHFSHDQWLACAIIELAVEQTGLEMGSFTHWVGSLHVYNKDLGEVF